MTAHKTTETTITLFGEARKKDMIPDHSRRPESNMRASTIASLILSTLLAGCSLFGDVPPSKHVSQSGTLKVNPELLKTPAAAETPAKDAAKN